MSTQSRLERLGMLDVPEADRAQVHLDAISKIEELDVQLERSLRERLKIKGVARFVSDVGSDAISMDAVSFSEKRALQKTIQEQSQILAGSPGFSEKRAAQKAKQDAMAKLGMVGLNAQPAETPALAENSESELNEDTPLANESEYHYEDAQQAFQHSNRYGAAVFKQDYVKSINSAYESLNKELNKEQKAYLDEQFIILKKGYLERDMRALRARSGMVSSHIAGRSNFKSSLATRGQSGYDNAVTERDKYLANTVDIIKAGILKRRDQTQLDTDTEKAVKKAKSKLLSAFLSPLQAMNDPGYEKSLFMGSAKKAWENLVSDDKQYALEVADKIDTAFKSQGTSLEKVIGARSNLWKQIQALRQGD